MTKVELEARVRELEEELRDAEEELEFEERVTEQLHETLDRLRDAQREPEELARAVHEFLSSEGLLSRDIPWKAAPTAWRQKLTNVLLDERPGDHRDLV